MDNANYTQRTPEPAWTKEGYEYEMADRIVALAGRIRHANKECAAIENKTPAMFYCRKNPDWKYWNSERGGAACEINMLVKGMHKMGYTTDMKELGDFLSEKYRAMLRNEAAGAKPTPIRFVPDSWIKGLDLPEVLALAPQIWKSYVEMHKVA